MSPDRAAVGAKKGPGDWAASPDDALPDSRTDRGSGFGVQGLVRGAGWAKHARWILPSGRVTTDAATARANGRQQQKSAGAALLLLGGVHGRGLAAQPRPSNQISDKLTNSYVSVIKDRFYVSMFIVGAKARHKTLCELLQRE